MKKLFWNQLLKLLDWIIKFHRRLLMLKAKKSLLNQFYKNITCKMIFNTYKILSSKEFQQPKRFQFQFLTWENNLLLDKFLYQSITTTNQLFRKSLQSKYLKRKTEEDMIATVMNTMIIKIGKNTGRNTGKKLAGYKKV